MTQPAAPLPASTVVLLRPSRGGSFEIYLNRRPVEMSSYAGVYVFPGGRVEESDYSDAMVSLTRGLTAREAQDKLRSDLPPELCLAHWVAAVRELFEEAGIYFFSANDDTPGGLSKSGLAERLAAKREALQRGELGLADLLISERLCCDVSRLIYFFHRVTPEHYNVRFDTRFYLAQLPADQRPLEVSEEVAESLWIAPEAALAQAEAGDFRMMPPTIAVLRQLHDYGSWEKLNEAFGLR
jgi:8-oxo-dGTP pyrophosphatase MutT (NUDIX family)